MSVGRMIGWSAAVAAVTTGVVTLAMYRLLDGERRAAERQGDDAAIAAAAAHLAAGDAGDAALGLSNAPPAERRWEWRYLLARSDESTAVLYGYPPAPLPPDGLSSDTRSRLGFGQDEVFWWDGGVVHVWERAGFTR